MILFLMLLLEKAGILSPNLAINCILEKLFFYVSDGKYSTESPLKKGKLNFVVSLSLTSVT